jgi:hypothetical protein
MNSKCANVLFSPSFLVVVVVEEEEEEEEEEEDIPLCVYSSSCV